MNVGIAGTGRMGSAIAAHVLEAFDHAARAGYGGIDGVRIPAWVSA